MYNFDSTHAEKLWKTFAPARMVDWSLGRPILLCDDDGEYLKPTPTYLKKMSIENNRRITSLGGEEKITSTLLSEVKLSVAKSKIRGQGVFANTNFSKNDIIGPYCGTILEDLDDDRDSDYDFYLNDGAHAVYLDGSTGAYVNALKYLNHSCAPNAFMTEIFIDGMWHVIVHALKDITKGEEITHDYKLISDDPKQLGIKCSCGSTICRGSLYSLD